MSFTLVAFHAHPDDESLLTGGTLARAAAEGHRVVLVLATLGGAGLAAGPRGGALALRRQDELRAAADALGCSRVELLGYLDSGLNAATAAPAPAGVTLAGASAISGSTPSDSTGDDGTDGGGTDGGGTDGGGDAARAGPAGDIAAGAGTTGAAMRFVDAPVEEAAERLAAVLRDEQADLLISYDSRGGYGHPDHVQVHRVGARAAALVGVPVVLEATIDRNALRPVLRLLRVAGRLLPRLPLGGLGTVFTPRREITHVVDVRPYLTQKRAALAAHASQTEGGGLRTVGVLLRLPDAVFARVAGREWFVQPGRVPGPSRDDIFADLR